MKVGIRDGMLPVSFEESFQKAKDIGFDGIEGDFSINITHNIVHASDCQENAQRELDILFTAEERYKYHRVDEAILHPTAV